MIVKYMMLCKENQLHRLSSCPHMEEFNRQNFFPFCDLSKLLVNQEKKHVES